VGKPINTAGRELHPAPRTRRPFWDDKTPIAGAVGGGKCFCAVFACIIAFAFAVFWANVTAEKQPQKNTGKLCTGKQREGNNMSKSHFPRDVPDQHGHFMLGSKALFLCHMPMFTMERHSYQVIWRGSLPPKIMREYRKLRAKNPNKPYNLINREDDKFILPDLKTGERKSFQATIYDGYSNEGEGEPGPILYDDVTVRVDEMVIFRHFDFAFDYPEPLTYYLFGHSGEAHLSHYITRDPDFQHLLTLPEFPDWLDPMQVRAGAAVNFGGLKSSPTPCANPLDKDAYDVQFGGHHKPVFPMPMGKGATVWFSTGNVLNKTNPCPVL
jgi:hypothetical protein